MKALLIICLYIPSPVSKSGFKQWLILGFSCVVEPVEQS